MHVNDYRKVRITYHGRVAVIDVRGSSSLYDTSSGLSFPLKSALDTRVALESFSISAFVVRV